LIHSAAWAAAAQALELKKAKAVLSTAPGQSSPLAGVLDPPATKKPKTSGGGARALDPDALSQPAFEKAVNFLCAYMHVRLLF
jgi:hypothetical protein